MEPVSLNPSFTAVSSDNGKQKTKEDIALGVGTTGAITYQAKQYTAKSQIKKIISGVTETGKAIGVNSKEATTLWGQYKQNVVRYANYAMKWVSKIGDHKYLAPILKNKFVLGAASVFGTVMAFFALVTGVNKSFENGKLMLVDLQDKFKRAA